MAEMVRVNTRISKTVNDWLNDESETTGLSKSTLIMLAIEQYAQQREVMRNISTMESISQRLDELEKKESK